MNDIQSEKQIMRLFQAITLTETSEECASFFEDLCTMQEIRAMAQRLEVAELLLQNHVYTDIEKATGASSATISRVSRFLQYGADGYKNIIQKLTKTEE